MITSPLRGIGASHSGSVFGAKLKVLSVFGMYLVDVVFFCDMLSMFVDFRVSGLVFVVSGLEPAKCVRCK